MDQPCIVRCKCGSLVFNILIRNDAPSLQCVHCSRGYLIPDDLLSHVTPE